MPQNKTNICSANNLLSLYYITLHYINYITLRYATLRHATPRHATPRHATPRHATPRHATPRHATPRHATPRHATPHHITSHYITKCHFEILSNKNAIHYKYDWISQGYFSITYSLVDIQNKRVRPIYNISLPSSLVLFLLVPQQPRPAPRQMCRC